MAGFNLAGKVKAVLEEQGRPLTAHEIAEHILGKYPGDCKDKMMRSERVETREDLVKAIKGEIVSAMSENKAWRRQGWIASEGKNPAKFYLPGGREGAFKTDVVKRDKRQAEQSTGAVAAKSRKRKPEESLYPEVLKFLWSKYQIYGMRIEERRSSNSQRAGSNHWLHPDLVGMEVLGKNWRDDISDCVSQYAETKTKLWSYEVKSDIRRSNVRRYFFQTVSNSSWANFGYLVADEIEDGAMDDLTILSNLHGIGFIKLDAENPGQSQIVLQARERENVDWNTANRIAEENKDFQKYVRNVTDFYKTGRTRVRDWNKFITSEDED